jgi:hypothetical protein
MSNLESNAAVAAKEEPSIVIKGNNVADMGEPCPFCGAKVDAKWGPTLYVEGTWNPICRSCGEQRAPHLVNAVDELRRKAKQKREAEVEAELKEAVLEMYGTRRPQRVIRYDLYWDQFNSRQSYGLEDVDVVTVLIRPDATKEQIVAAMLQFTNMVNGCDIERYPEPKDPVAFLKTPPPSEDLPF